MKRFLVPTDFSAIARNTLDYATELAKYSFAELILFHAYYQPVLANDLTVSQPFFEELEADCRNNLEELKQQVLAINPDLRVTCEYRLGLPAATIDEFARANRIDLIVMGTQGTGYLVERLLGSIATALIREAACPVLVIDREVRFRSPAKIVLAADYQEAVPIKSFKLLKNLLTNFDAHLYILHISSEYGDEIDLDELIEKYDLDDSFKYYDHSLISTKNSEVIEGINDFVAVHDADMVVMVPRKHNFVERIFREPTVNKMAFHSKVPLLALHH